MNNSFPQNPAIGQIYVNPKGYAWVYNGKGWQSRGTYTIVSGGGSGSDGQPGATGPQGPTGPPGTPGTPGQNLFFYQNTPPTQNLHIGAMWFNTDNGKTYAYASDGETQFWLQIN